MAKKHVVRNGIQADENAGEEQPSEVAADVPDGHIPLRHAHGCAVCCIAGTQYDADEFGVFVVPEHDAAHLIESHGFTVSA